MEEAEKFRLAFALPHVARKAGASLGLRAFEEASRHLNRGEQLASELVDPALGIDPIGHLTLLAQGDSHKAAVIPMPREDIGGSAGRGTSHACACPRLRG